MFSKESFLKGIFYNHNSRLLFPLLKQTQTCRETIREIPKPRYKIVGIPYGFHIVSLSVKEHMGQWQILKIDRTVYARIKVALQDTGLSCSKTTFWVLRHAIISGKLVPKWVPPSKKGWARWSPQKRLSHRKSHGNRHLAKRDRKL